MRQQENHSNKIKNVIDAAFETNPNDLKQFITEFKNKEVYTLQVECQRTDLWDHFC